MNENTLSMFRQLAQNLGERRKTPITIVLKDGRRVEATFDPLFRSIELGNATFPDREITTWIKLFCGSEPVKIIGTE